MYAPETLTRGTSRQVRAAPLISTRRVLLALTLIGCFGIALRFVGFSSRLFWTDEGITALRTAGYTDAQFEHDVIDGRPHRVSDLRRYLGYGPRGSTLDVVRSLAVEDAQHPPLYYVLASWWTRAWGFSLFTLRLFSVLIGCCVPFAVAWLCFELYGSRLAAGFGFALSAFSPILVIYSQQAREYGLWAVFIALSTAALLRAARADRTSWWIAYGVCLVAGMYTDTLFFTVLISHAIFAAIRLRGRRLGCFSVSLAVAIAAFAPWAAQIALHRRAIELSNAGTQSAWPLRMLVEKWIFNAGTTFFDVEFARASLAIVLIYVFGLVVLALYWNARAAARIRVMALSLVAVPAALFLPDLLLHQHRSTVTRYGMALWVALLVCVAGFLAARLRKGWDRRAWLVLSALLLAIGVTSSVVDVRSSVWWDNRGDAQNIALSALLNRPPPPLVVIPGNWARVLAMTVYLNPDVTFQMVGLHSVVRPRPGYPRALLLARTQEAAAFKRHGIALAAMFHSRENNAQVRAFRGTDDGREYLSLWRFLNYAGTPP
jgi:uncharacterized membrane protein